jgi:uncharacterized protein YdhG (YjbR/CyaY superfamily)
MQKPTTVDEYLSWVPEAHRPLLDGLRETIKAVAPEATEVIAYGMPAFRLDGRFFVSYSDFKNHVSLFPATDAMIEELGDELQPHVFGKGTLRFRADQPLPRDLVARIIAIRLKERGQPA